MRKIIRIVVVFFVMISVVGGVGLVVMSGAARFEGVHEVPIPPYSYLTQSADKPDYTDAWRAELRLKTFRSIDQVARAAFRRGRELYRSENEVVFVGTAPGIHYEVSYFLEQNSQPPALIVSTAVYLDSSMGRAYWTIGRPVHRLLVPFRVNRMARF